MLMKVIEEIKIFFSNGKSKKILFYVGLFVISLIIVLCIKSCTNNSVIPQEFKHVKEILNEVEFEKIKYTTNEKELNELLELMEIETATPNKALVAFKDNDEEIFIVVQYDALSLAEDAEWEFAWFIVENDLYNYDVKRVYTTIYCGHKELLSKILE